MSDVTPTTAVPPPCGGGGTVSGRFSYDAVTAWWRQRLLPVLFPSPASGGATPPLHAMTRSQVSRSLAVQLDERGAVLLSLTRSPERRSVSEGSREGLATSTAAAPPALLQCSPPPPLSIGPSNVDGITGTDPAPVVRLSPTPATSSSVRGTLWLKPSPVPSYPSHELGYAATPPADSHRAVSTVRVPTPLLSHNRVTAPSTSSAASTPFLHPVSPSSPFAGSSDSFAGVRTSPACVELPGPQSLFFRGTDPLACSGRSPRLLRGESRSEVTEPGAATPA